jgi:AcrR family transcriptional regulator
MTHDTTATAGPDEIASGAAGPDEIASGAAGPDEIASGAAGRVEIARGASAPEIVGPARDDRAVRDDVAVARDSTLEPEVDGRRLRGRRTRESILDAAVDLASVEGLDGLSIGRLATELGMSKSGLFAHFGSKEELQLATIDTARAIFIKEVIEPARQAERGLPRLVALLDHWLEYKRGEVFYGGCFFDAVRTEYDSREPSPVREAVLSDFAAWSEILANRVRAAQAAGHLDPDADPEQLAFELDALGGAANLRFQLARDEAAFERARGAIRARLDVVTVR